MITPNGIQYAWKQIFSRLGVSAVEDHFLFGNDKVFFHYGSPAGFKLADNHFHLVIPAGNPKDINLMCDDAGFPVSRLVKSEFFPSIDEDFPVDTLPFFFWGYSAAKNGFAAIQERTLILQPDLIQVVFFLLTRYEEYYLETADTHGRFPFSASAAYRHDFINLPLVDLYVLLLKIWLEALTGKSVPAKGKFTIGLSHDIDYLTFFQPFGRWSKVIAKDILGFKWKYLKADFQNLSPNFSQDPYFLGIKRLAEISANYQLSSTFNLMAASPSAWDEGYPLDSEVFRQVVEIIREHGHSIGLHASHQSFDQAQLLPREKLLLEAAIGSEIPVVRQHYLRVKTSQTWQAQETSGLQTDTSYGFPEHEGFRCGTCQPYQVFDLVNDREMHLVEEPLIVMDTTLRTHRKLSVNEAAEKIMDLARICKSVRGKFTLLWHNTSFLRDWQSWGDRYPQITSGLVNLAEED